MGGHDVFAARLGRLMAALAMGLEDRADLFVVADLGVGLIGPAIAGKREPEGRGQGESERAETEHDRHRQREE
jgi:hypothetical protein